MKLTTQESRRVIDACLDGGINMAETAAGYGDSEEKLSHALKKCRDQMVMITKSPSRTAAGMTRAIDKSLARLQTDYIDIYQVHILQSREQLEQIFAPGGAMEALRDARSQGKIRHIGVTGHRAGVLADAIRTGDFDTIQVPVNVVDREAEKDLLPLAKELNIGILAMKPVCGGMLDDPALGIRFCLNSLADAILIGMKSVAEVEANLATVRAFRPLGAAEEEELLANATQLGNQFCRRCGYCQPCPAGINIPRILWLDNYHRRYAERDSWTEEEYAALEANINDCEDCARCESKCPYDLPIREMLKSAQTELTASIDVIARRKVKKAIKKILPIRKGIE